MYLLVIILHREEYLNDVLEALLELGVEDAITMDAESTKRALAYRVPIFAGLRLGMGERPFSKVIFAITDNKNAGKELINMLKTVDVDLEAKGVARIMMIKLEEVYGTPEEIEEI